MMISAYRSTKSSMATAKRARILTREVTGAFGSTAFAVAVIFLVLRPAAAIDSQTDVGSTKADLPAVDRAHAASASTGSANRSDVNSAAALALLPEGMSPRVLIRFSANNGDARRRAEGLAKTLTGQGIEVADIRESVAPIRTEIKFSYLPDRAFAQRVGSLAGIQLQRAALTKDGLMPRPGTVQLNISGR